MKPVLNADSPDANAAIRGLLAYCRANEWAGHDPYDALNSLVFRALPFLNSRVPQLLLTQAMKRAPVNLRRLALIPKTQNPKAIALFLAALVKIARVEESRGDDLVRPMIERLVALRSPDARHWCWGYSFPWQTRTVVVPRWAPNLVCTTFVGECAAGRVRAAWRVALSDHGGERGRVHPERALLGRRRLPQASAIPCRRRAFRSPTRTSSDRRASLSRVPADRRHEIPRSGPRGRPLFGLAAARRWLVGLRGRRRQQRWIDNFHTGYNLCALHSIGRSLGTTEFEPSSAADSPSTAGTFSGRTAHRGISTTVSIPSTFTAWPRASLP